MNGDTKIYTKLEEKLLEDFEDDNKLRKERELEFINDLPKNERNKRIRKMTKAYMLIPRYIMILYYIIMSNTDYICYLIMIVAHIMNGNLLSLVYPMSIFIYAMLLERNNK
jgi:hypothetical protein